MPSESPDRDVPLRWRAGVFGLVGALTLLGCGAAPVTASAPRFDTPVPASEPRAEVHLAVTLASVANCEEAFDLALYADRSVELVAWDPPQATCGPRTVTIRFLAQRTTAEKVLSAAKKAAASASAAPPSPAASSPR